MSDLITLIDDCIKLQATLDDFVTPPLQKSFWEISHLGHLQHGELSEK